VLPVVRLWRSGIAQFHPAEQAFPEYPDVAGIETDIRLDDGICHTGRFTVVRSVTVQDEHLILGKLFERGYAGFRNYIDIAVGNAARASDVLVVIV
jgi:hypothetical protein